MWSQVERVGCVYIRVDKGTRSYGGMCLLGARWSGLGVYRPERTRDVNPDLIWKLLSISCNRIKMSMRRRNKKEKHTKATPHFFRSSDDE